MKVVEVRTTHKNADGTGPLWAVWELYDDGHTESRHFDSDGHLLFQRCWGLEHDDYPPWWKEQALDLAVDAAEATAHMRNGLSDAAVSG